MHVISYDYCHCIPSKACELGARKKGNRGSLVLILTQGRNGRLPFLWVVTAGVGTLSTHCPASLREHGYKNTLI